MLDERKITQVMDAKAGEHHPSPTTLDRIKHTWSAEAAQTKSNTSEAEPIRPSLWQRLNVNKKLEALIACVLLVGVLGTVAVSKSRNPAGGRPTSAAVTSSPLKATLKSASGNQATVYLFASDEKVSTFDSPSCMANAGDQIRQGHYSVYLQPAGSKVPTKQEVGKLFGGEVMDFNDQRPGMLKVVPSQGSNILIIRQYAGCNNSILSALALSPDGSKITRLQFETKDGLTDTIAAGLTEDIKPGLFRTQSYNNATGTHSTIEWEVRESEGLISDITIRPSQPSQTPTMELGIIESREAFPNITTGMQVVNRWQGEIGNGGPAIVFAGSADGHGLVLVAERWSDGRTAKVDRYPTPTNRGSVRITAEKESRLTLVAEGGATFIFDAESRSYIQDGQVAPFRQGGETGPGDWNFIGTQESLYRGTIMDLDIDSGVLKSLTLKVTESLPMEGQHAGNHGPVNDLTVEVVFEENLSDAEHLTEVLQPGGEIIAVIGQYAKPSGKGFRGAKFDRTYYEAGDKYYNLHGNEVDLRNPPRG